MPQIRPTKWPMPLLISNRAGNVGMVFAVALPFLVAGVGATVDYVTIAEDRQLLQEAFDAAAMEAVSSLASGKASTADAERQARSFVMSAVDAELADIEREEVRTRLSVIVNADAGKLDVRISGGFTVARSPFSPFGGYAQSSVSVARLASATLSR